MIQGAYILDCVRTPRARVKAGSSAFSGLHPQELLAQTMRELLDRNNTDPSQVEDVVIGCVTEVGEQGGNIARNAVLAAGLPTTIGGVSLNRYCASGLQAINFAAMQVASGMSDLLIAGGVESMSRVPMLSDGSELDGRNMLLRKKLSQIPQGISADLLATLEGFGRERLDQFGVDSQRKASIAQAEHRFAKSLFPVRDPISEEVLLSQDNGIRESTTLEALSSLEPAFAKLGTMRTGDNGRSLDQVALSYYPQLNAIHHVHTAGSSSGIVDGAAAVLLCSEQFLQQNKLRPRARIKSTAIGGSDPILMLNGPIEVSMRALKLAGMSKQDIDLWEINEAFSVVPLLVMDKLRLDSKIVNVNGGAIAMGHPLGATGAILVGIALDELERRNLSTALITLCVAGGQAIATIIERVFN